VLTVLAANACAPGARRMALPAGAGTPTTEFAAPFAEAAARCREIVSLQAELGLSGHAGRQRLRGRVLAGFATGAMRLEGVAPFGSPAFIFVADTSQGTLLLPRDHRVLQGATPSDMLNALIGVPLGPDDLRAVLSGCIVAAGEPKTGHQYGPDWLSIDVAPSSVLYLQRQASGWRIVAGRYAGLDMEYPKLGPAHPEQIVIRSAAADVELTIGLNQVEVNGDLPQDALVDVKIPPGTQPITIDELRRAGPLGERD
jgi:hypothetical protein